MKSHVILFHIFPLLAVCGSGVAQTPAPTASSEPKTKLEQFQAKTGSVIVHGYSKVGSLAGQLGTAIAVESKEFTDASTGAKQYGITVEIKGAGRLETSSTSYVDYDEIESLLKGIDYVAAVNKTVTKLQQFQADYRTRGDLIVSTYSGSQSGEVEAAVKSGHFGNATAYLSLIDLGKFRQLIQTAYTTLQTLKGTQ